MCWNPCLKISDVEVTQIEKGWSFKQRPAPDGSTFTLTEEEAKKEIAKSIPESACDQGCPCKVAKGERKEPHEGADKNFRINVTVKGKGSVEAWGRCDIKYNTQNGICEPNELVHPPR